MNHKAMNQTVATAVRVEYEQESDTLFLVFKVVDERLKQEVKKDWMKDIDVQLIGKSLVREE